MSAGLAGGPAPPPVRPDCGGARVDQSDLGRHAMGWSVAAIPLIAFLGVAMLLAVVVSVVLTTWLINRPPRQPGNTHHAETRHDFPSVQGVLDLTGPIAVFEDEFRIPPYMCATRGQR